MPYAVSNNGLTQKWHDPSEHYSPVGGELLLDDNTSATILAAFSGYTAALAAQAMAGTAAADLATRIAEGIVITSTGTPSLNATYALDDQTQSEIDSIALAFAAGLGLPGGGGTFAYPDASGTPHSFTGTQIVNLRAAIQSLVLQLQQQSAIEAAGGTPSWPSNAATIA